MKKHHKHLHLARRKMSRIIDEIYTALLHYGCRDFKLHIARGDEGLRLFVDGDFLPEHLAHVQRMNDLLHPVVRSAAMVEEFWELAGEDQYTSDSELALVGQMVDEASMQIEDNSIHMELFVQF